LPPPVDPARGWFPQQRVFQAHGANKLDCRSRYGSDHRLHSHAGPDELRAGADDPAGRPLNLVAEPSPPKRVRGPHSAGSVVLLLLACRAVGCVPTGRPHVRPAKGATIAGAPARLPPKRNRQGSTAPALSCASRRSASSASASEDSATRRKFDRAFGTVAQAAVCRASSARFRYSASVRSHGRLSMVSRRAASHSNTGDRCRFHGGPSSAPGRGARFLQALPCDWCATFQPSASSTHLDRTPYSGRRAAPPQ